MTVVVLKAQGDHFVTLTFDGPAPDLSGLVKAKIHWVGETGKNWYEIEREIVPAECYPSVT